MSQCRMHGQLPAGQSLELGAQRARMQLQALGHAHQVGQRHALQRQRKALAQRRQVGTMAVRARPPSPGRPGRTRRPRSAGSPAPGSAEPQAQPASGSTGRSACGAARVRVISGPTNRARARTTIRSVAAGRAARRPASRMPATSGWRRPDERMQAVVQRHGDAEHRLAGGFGTAQARQGSPASSAGRQRRARHLQHAVRPGGRTSGTGTPRSAAAPPAPGCTKPTALDGANRCACSFAPCGTRLASADAGDTLWPGSASTAVTVPACGARTTIRRGASCSAASRASAARSRSISPCRLLASNGRPRNSPSSAARSRAASAPWRCRRLRLRRRPSSSSRFVCTWAGEMNWSCAQRLQPLQRLLGQRQALTVQAELRCRSATALASSSSRRRSSDRRCASASSACCSAASCRLRWRSSRLRRTRLRVHRRRACCSPAPARTARRRPPRPALRRHGARAPGPAPAAPAGSRPGRAPARR